MIIRIYIESKFIEKSCILIKKKNNKVSEYTFDFDARPLKVNNNYLPL